jgi:2',3'-cyclic-nucleotide 2'-phosphodiesterase (5'-nucleotidase family)
MPFENALVMLELSGRQTNQLLQYIATRGGEPVAGLRMQIVDKNPLQVEIRSQVFDSTKTYHVATSDYLANGGDNLDFLKDCKRTNLNLKVRDAMINDLQARTLSGDTLTIQTDGRIRK